MPFSYVGISIPMERHTISEAIVYTKSGRNSRTDKFKTSERVSFIKSVICQNKRMPVESVGMSGLTGPDMDLLSNVCNGWRSHGCSVPATIPHFEEWSSCVLRTKGGVSNFGLRIFSQLWGWDC